MFLEYRTEEGYDIYINPDSVLAVISLKENRCKIVLKGYIANIIAPIDHILEQLENGVDLPIESPAE